MSSPDTRGWTLAGVFFWGYTLMLLGVGLSGMLLASWELPVIFAVPLDAMDDVQRATLLNQYRFLKALELAFGLYCMAYRREIFTPDKAHRVFLAGLAAGVLARLGSCLADGVPKTAFLIFMGLELLTGVLVWRAVPRICDSPRQQVHTLIPRSNVTSPWRDSIFPP